MNSPPKVTIIIANHNYGKYLGQAIDSAINQDYPSIDIVVVDDFSSDNSWEVIHKKLFKGITHDKRGNEHFEMKSGTLMRFGNIKCNVTAYKLLKNVGPSEARNLAIHNAISNTDYFAILDADDEYYPSKVRELVNTAICSNNIGVVYADYDILNVDTGNLVREYKQPFSLNKLHQECIVHSGALINKDALVATLEPTGYYDINLRCAEDYDLWLRISEKFIIVHVPKSLSLVRTHSENSTNSVQKEIWERCWAMVARKFQIRHGNPQ